MQRMEEIIKDGRTLIFVSHGAGLVQQVCRRAVFLQHGKMIFDGDVDDAFAAYKESVTKETKEEHQRTSSENCRAKSLPAKRLPADEEPDQRRAASEEPPS